MKRYYLIASNADSLGAAGIVQLQVQIMGNSFRFKGFDKIK